MKVLEPTKATCPYCFLDVSSYYECEPARCECGHTRVIGSKVEIDDLYDE